MRSLEIVHALRAAEPIPRASQKLFGRYQAALRFGSRNSVSLWGRDGSAWAVCQRETMWRCKTASPPCALPSRSPIPLDVLSRIPTASLGEPSGEGSAPLLCRIGDELQD